MPLRVWPECLRIAKSKARSKRGPSSRRGGFLGFIGTVWIVRLQAEDDCSNQSQNTARPADRSEGSVATHTRRKVRRLEVISDMVQPKTKACHATFYWDRES